MCVCHGVRNALAQKMKMIQALIRTSEMVRVHGNGVCNIIPNLAWLCLACGYCLDGGNGASIIIILFLLVCGVVIER